MRVAIVSFGHIDFIVALAKYLTKKISVDLYIIIDKNRSRESILNLDTFILNDGLLRDSLTSEIIGGKIENYIQNKFRVNIFIYNNFKILNPNNLKLPYLFAKILKKYQYDLIHFNGNNLQQLWISFFYQNIPKVHSIHDYIGHSGERRLIAELFNKYIVCSGSQKIFHSRWCASAIGKKLRNIRPETINIIPYGIPTIYKIWENPLLTEEDNTILFFGRVSLYKGIEYLIKAAPIIRKEIPDLKIILAGEGKYNLDISVLKNDNSYRIINRYISNMELVELIQRSTLVVCPYTDATQSGVIMTSYVFNKPVVATSVGGIPEVVNDEITGKLVPPKNPEKLAEAIIELLKNPEKRKMISENIKNKFSQGDFNWDSIADKTIAVYKKALVK